MPILVPERTEPEARLLSGPAPVGAGPRRVDRPFWHGALLAALATVLGAVALVGLGDADDGAVSLRADNGTSTTTATGATAPSAVAVEADLDLVGWRSPSSPSTTSGSAAMTTNPSTTPPVTAQTTTDTTLDSTTENVAGSAAPPTLSTAASSTTPVADAPPTSAPAGPERTSTSTSTTAAPTTAPPTGASGELLWEESFSTLDTSRWALEHSTYGDGNNELQCYRPENVSVSAGVLRLRAVTETYTCPNGSTRSVTSGMVRSRGVTFEPGQALEFRVRLTPADPDDQGGLWPAVWSSGWAGGGWPQGGELDYLEVMTAKSPNRSVYSIHYAKPGGGHGVTNKEVFSDEPFSAAWHIVRFEYGRNGRLVWYLDGVQVHAVDAADTLQGYPTPFDQGIGEIKINLALGGRPGPLSPSAVGSAGAMFEVDYLRVYRL